MLQIVITSTGNPEILDPTGLVASVFDVAPFLALWKAGFYGPTPNSYPPGTQFTIIVNLTR